MLSCAALCGFSLTSRAQDAAAPASADLDTLTPALLELMRREDVPGLQVALIRGGDAAQFKAFGVMKRDADMTVTTETLFEAASLTKPVFAYLVMKLIEEGRLDLDTRLYKILDPPASGPKDLVRDLTPAMILSHSTGFPNWYRDGVLVSLRPSQGRLFSYSGMAYVYLQKVVEKITGQGLGPLLQERVFTPMGMTNASMIWRDDFDSRLAHGHTRDGKIIRYKMPEANAASSLVCTAQDYARFAAALLKPPVPNPFYLRPDTIKGIFTPRVEAGPEISWGLGWGLQQPKSVPASFFHWGNNGSVYNCFVVGCPSSGEGAVVMTNSGNGLRVCRDFVPSAVSGDHPALRWSRVVGG